MKTSKLLYQWDVNQSFIDCAGSSVDYTINGEVYRIEVIDRTAIIPDELLQEAGDHICYLNMIDGTRTEIRFTVKARPMPPDYVSTPTQRTTFDGLAAKVDELVAEVQTKLDNGDFNGKDGKDGKDGANGKDGNNGVDGFSPRVDIDAISGGHKIVIVDAEGEHSFNVLNGKDGAKGDKGAQGIPGEQGADGFSPSAKVERTASGAKITITDKDGTTETNVFDGQGGGSGGGNVDDVQINGISILDENKVANIPIAKNKLGAIQIDSYFNINADSSNGKVYPSELTKENYDKANGKSFISKTTLENRLAPIEDELSDHESRIDALESGGGSGGVSKAYVDEQIDSLKKGYYSESNCITNAKLDINGKTISSSGLLVSNKINTSNLAKVKVFATGADSGNICLYKEDDTFLDYWTSYTREVDVSQADYIRVTFSMTSDVRRVEDADGNVIYTPKEAQYEKGIEDKADSSEVEQLKADLSELDTEVQNHETRIEALEQGGGSGGNIPYIFEYWDKTKYGEIVDGAYINKNVQSSSNGYFSIKFIPVKPQSLYDGHSNMAEPLTDVTYARFINFYDENKTFISGSDYPFTLLEIPNNVYFISVSIPYLTFGDYSSKGEYWLKEHGADMTDLYVFTAGKLSKDSIQSVSSWSGKRLIMFGDSITSAELDDENKGGYVGRLREYFNLTVADNMGRSGYPMTKGLGTTSINETVKNAVIYLHTNYLNYDLCLIACGTNDFRLNAPLGVIAEPNSTFDTNTFYGAYQDAIEYIMKANKGLRFALMTPLHRNNSGYTDYSTNTAGCKLIDYINAIKEIGKTYSIPVIDMFANSGLNYINLSTYTVDGLHPNGIGYDLITPYVCKQLETV